MGYYDELLSNYDKDYLIALIGAYDMYIVDAFDDADKIASGWVPVCFAEFIESEECANYMAQIG